MNSVKLLKEKIKELGNPEYLDITPTIECDDDENDRVWFIFCLRMEYEGDEIKEIEVQYCTERSRYEGFEASLFDYFEDRQEWIAAEVLDVLNNY